MACTSSGIGCNKGSSGCPDVFGCISGQCPDLTLKRHDNKPQFKVSVSDCDGPLDLTDLVTEASMFATGKLKKSIAATDTYFSLADNIGFFQIMVGDIIIMDQIRMPEKMLVTAFDEKNYYVQVERGYQGTTAQTWKKGNPLKIMKFINQPAETLMVYQDIINIDGTTTTDVHTDSFLIYNWGPTDTCLPGCYYLEFKLIKMTGLGILSDPTPVFGPSDLTPSDYGCGLGINVEWIRRFPVDASGFIIQITDSPTAEG